MPCLRDEKRSAGQALGLGSLPGEIDVGRNEIIQLVAQSEDFVGTQVFLIE